MWIESVLHFCDKQTKRSLRGVCHGINKQVRSWCLHVDPPKFIKNTRRWVPTVFGICCTFAASDRAANSIMLLVLRGHHVFEVSNLAVVIIRNHGKTTVHFSTDKLADRVELVMKRSIVYRSIYKSQLAKQHAISHETQSNQLPGNI